jgi:GNAT superfamily N-acetyltransferase
MTAGIDTIRGLEERAFNAWPALQTILADGWVLRLAAGYTKRANSINALAPSTPLADLLPLARSVYGRAGLPLIARLSPLAGPDADPCLAARDWRRRDETLVMTAPLFEPFAADPGVAIAPAPDARWSECFAVANNVPPQHRATHDRMLASIGGEPGFARLDQDDRTVALGLAVIERRMVGLFDIVTDPAARRQGHGRRLVSALLAWGRAQGATGAYLQVVAANAPAIALYRDLGFTEGYRYHYRVAP